MRVENWAAISEDVAEANVAREGTVVAGVVGVLLVCEETTVCSGTTVTVVAEDDEDMSIITVS